MSRRSLKLLGAAALALLASNSLASETAPGLVGVWKLNVACKTLRYVNIVTIGRADTRKVLGTTNVDDNFGKIVSESFDGVNFQFQNTYLWEGKRHHEDWTGTLSRNGKSIKGRFVSDGVYAGESNCRFSGPRR